VVRIAASAGEDELLLAARDNLAGAVREMGDAEGAERLYEEVLQARRRVLGERHPDVGYSLNNLGELYRSLGRYSAAEACFREALELLRGGAAAVAATVMSNLALVHDSVGDRAEALLLHRRVLALRRRALGRHHPDLATTLRYLGDLYCIAGQLVRAERRLRQALRITAAASGEDHPDPAALLGDAERYAEAEPLFRRALEIDRAALVDAHPRVAVHLANVGETARATGRLDEAEAAFHEALARMRGDPPNAALARARLAWIAGACGDGDAAFALLRDAMEREDRLLHEVFAAAPEERRLAFLGTLRLTLFHLLSLASVPGAPDAVRGAARRWTRCCAARGWAPTRPPRSARWCWAATPCWQPRTGRTSGSAVASPRARWTTPARRGSAPTAAACVPEPRGCGRWRGSWRAAFPKCGWRSGCAGPGAPTWPRSSPPARRWWRSDEAGSATLPWTVMDKVPSQTHPEPTAMVKPPLSTGPEPIAAVRVLISLRREAGDAVRVTVSIGDTAHTGVSYPSLPPAVLEAQGLFLHGIRAGIRGAEAGARPGLRHLGRHARQRNSQERALAQLGHALRAFCLPGDSGEALTAVVNEAIGTTVEICFEAEDPALLGLPFEALRLPDNRTLALQRSVVMFRRPTGVRAADGEPLAGPVKVLVAVGAPDEGTSSIPLDQERELQNILDAVTVAQRHENFDVRILEVGSPGQIADAIGRDAYHILHVSCHGRPGALELEDEDGQAVQTTAAELVAPIRKTHRPLPMVLLNACDGGVVEGQTASLAEALLRAGVPAVLAMQTRVSDFYAIEFARTFYHHLSSRDYPLASRALASARKELERARQEAVGRGASLAETRPEFATASLYVAGEERPLADFTREKEPLRVRPVHPVAGPVPQLGIDDLIGRRNEQRKTLRTLRDGSRQYAGVVLTGIGGVGKSAVAGRVMQRLSEAGWLLSAHAGRFDLGAIGERLGAGLLQAGRPEAVELGRLIAANDVDDEARLQLVAKALAEEQVLLVLDDFEQNLKPGGDEFLDPAVGDILRLLARRAHRGRLLLTCRHPVPEMDDLLWRVPLGPLSRAETQKLLLRLDSLRGRDLSELATVVRVIGGHPRMLEFLDALLRGGQGRLPHVTEKLQDLLTGTYLDAADAVAGLDEGLSAAVALGARDVLLSELLAIARGERIDEALLQTAVSNLPVEPAGLARMLADGGEGDPASATRALERLEDLSLVHRFADKSAWVHRWTAEGLAGLVEAEEHRARHLRGGHYRWWRVGNESHGLRDAVEAVRNFLAGEDFDAAVEVAQACFDALRRFRQSIGVAALASEVLETLPPTHSAFAVVADVEGQAHLALGFTERAFARYRNLLTHHERLAQAKPDHADFQHALSVSYSKVGSLYLELGQGEQAREAFLASLQIAERLAQAEPDRADFQRALLAAYNEVGDLYRALGQGEQAREAFLASLRITERLAQAEPDHADVQRKLSVAYERVGDLYRDLGQGERAREALLASLRIAERLAQAEPDRADFQHDLTVAYIKVGDLSAALGEGEQAQQAYLASLRIAELLAQDEPDRTDFQRALTIAYDRIGSLYRDIGKGEQARQAFLASLRIIERLAQAEPHRTNFQRDLSVAYERVADLYRDLGLGEQARQALLTSLEIRERLVQAEPDRADFQRDLSVTFNKVGDLYCDLGLGEQARQALLTSLQIRERLVQAEPDRADFQHDLSVAYNKLGEFYLNLEQGEQARQFFLASLEIAERLAQAEPDRADYQRDLAVAHNKVGGLYYNLGQGEQAQRALLASLKIYERLAQTEPDRADYQRDLSVTYNKVGDLYLAFGQAEQARQVLLASLQIAERLAQAEPDRTDLQRDLSVTYNKVGDLYLALGQGEQAREYFVKDLQITERLVQAEPDHADHQRDLVISLGRVGKMDNDTAAGAATLRRALAILSEMKARGQLALVDDGLVDWVKGLLNKKEGHRG
jgi:tetratricopeptide (TPR) repeat protein